MGPEDENKFTLYVNGDPVTQWINLPEIKAAKGEPEPTSVIMYQSMALTFHFKIPKRWRCRSRKRFVKLVMSEGISRNRAEWLADFVRGLMPYSDAWQTYLLRTM